MTISDGSERRGIHYRARGKRALDLALALGLLPFLAPVIAVLWCLVRLDGGPGFYGHWRVGRDGKPFRCWKLRSMRPDADVVLAGLLARDPVARREWTQNFRLRRDPRVTRLGRITRRLHLDELPQIWNVIRGDMAFVGPRPVTYDELKFYYDSPECYLGLRPGVTGLWQVEARHVAGFGIRTALDRRYLQDMSAGKDLRVMIRTLGAPIGRASSRKDAVLPAKAS